MTARVFAPQSDVRERRGAVRTTHGGLQAVAPLALGPVERGFGALMAP